MKKIKEFQETQKLMDEYSKLGDKIPKLKNKIKENKKTAKTRTEKIKSVAEKNIEAKNIEKDRKIIILKERMESTEDDKKFDLDRSEIIKEYEKQIEEVEKTYEEEIKQIKESSNAEIKETKEKIKQENIELTNEINKTEDDRKYFRTDAHLKTITMEIEEIKREIAREELDLNKLDIELQEFYMQENHENPLRWQEIYKEQDAIKENISELKSKIEEYTNFKLELSSIDLTPEEYKIMNERENAKKSKKFEIPELEEIETEDTNIPPEVQDYIDRLKNVKTEKEYNTLYDEIEQRYGDDTVKWVKYFIPALGETVDRLGLYFKNDKKTDQQKIEETQEEQKSNPGEALGKNPFNIDLGTSSNGNKKNNVKYTDVEFEDIYSNVEQEDELETGLDGIVIDALGKRIIWGHGSMDEPDIPDERIKEKEISYGDVDPFITLGADLYNLGRDRNIEDLLYYLSEDNVISSEYFKSYFDGLEKGAKIPFWITYNLKDIYKSDLSNKEIKNLFKVAKQANKRNPDIIVKKDNILKRAFGRTSRAVNSTINKLKGLNQQKKQEALPVANIPERTSAKIEKEKSSFVPTYSKEAQEIGKEINNCFDMDAVYKVMAENTEIINGLNENDVKYLQNIKDNKSKEFENRGQGRQVIIEHPDGTKETAWSRPDVEDVK